MSRMTGFKVSRVAAVAVLAGGVGIGALALVTPALADTVVGPWVTSSAGHSFANGHSFGNGRGQGMGMGQGAAQGAGQGMGRGMGNGGNDGAVRGGASGAEAGRGQDGECTDLDATAPQGTLNDAQRTALAAMANEEKLAGDLYQAFADKYDTAVFDRIAVAEDRHLSALRTLMTRYGVADPTKDQAGGKFTDSAVQATYDRLLAEGSASEQAASAVGKKVEQADLDDLHKALEGLDTADTKAADTKVADTKVADTKQVYTRLSQASQRHLAAFGR